MTAKAHLSRHSQASVARAVAYCCLPSALGMKCVYFPQPAHFTSNRSQSQHSLLTDAEGRSAESSLSSPRLAFNFPFNRHTVALNACRDDACPQNTNTHTQSVILLPPLSSEVEPGYYKCVLCVHFAIKR